MADSAPDESFIPPFFVPEIRALAPQRAESYVGLSYGVEQGYRHLQLDLHVPSVRDGAVPLIVWMHGGAWLFGVRDLLPQEWPAGAIAQTAIDAGFAIATIDYRHSREAAFPAQLFDAKAAIRYLRAFGGPLGVDTTRIAVWGESAGGHLAALAALVRDPQLEGTVGLQGPSSEVSAAVCFYPVTDVTTLPAMGGMMDAAASAAPFEPVDILIEHSPYPREEARRLLSPISHVRADAPPMLLIHGSDDGLVPASQSESLAAALTQAGASVDLDIVPGADHVFSGVDPMPQIARALEFFAAKLRG